MSDREWSEVTRTRPCPACGKPDWCAWTRDGWLRCKRSETVPDGMRLVKTCAEGALFRPVDARQAKAPPPRRPRVRATPASGAAFDGDAEQVRFVAALTPDRRAALAAELGVADAALASLGCGWASREDLDRLGAGGKGWQGERPHGAYTFPERDGAGAIVGFSLRAEDGRKGAFSRKAGTQRGVCCPADLASLPDPVVAVEGVTDTAACLTMGLAAVGRPSAAGGGVALSVMLDGRSVVVLGENDCKPDGLWPGRKGAMRVADGLAVQGVADVVSKLPPSGAKDAREWLRTHMAEGNGSSDEAAKRSLGRAFLAELRDATTREDSNRAPRELDRARNEWEPRPLTELGPTPPPEWVWTGYLARGFATLLGALWKAGKTTLVSWLLHDLEHGGGLAPGQRGITALVVSEECQRLWMQRRDHLGLGDAVHLVPSPFRMRPTPSEWAAFVEHVAELVRTRGYGLVVFDALPALWPVANENDAAQVLEALTPMRAITEAGAALLLVNHPRKGDATEAQSSRGSGALPGWVDIIVEMRRHRPEDRADRRRVLSAYSRFEDTPVEAVLELRDDGYAYIGDRAMLNEEERKRTIAQVLRDSDGALTVQEVKSRWPSQMVPGAATLRADLQAGAESGLWMRTGAGKRNDPHRFHSPSELDSRTPPVIGGRIESAASAQGGEGGRP